MRGRILWYRWFIGKLRPPPLRWSRLLLYLGKSYAAACSGGVRGVCLTVGLSIESQDLRGTLGTVAL